MTTPKIKKPKFFLPGDKVKIEGEKGVFIIESWTNQYEYDRKGKDYKNWEYATTQSAWHPYEDITLIEAGWMRKMLNN